jgi:hypothetical protein
MSTLNVANISDDQSTLTGSSSNPNDKLNLNTTVDTKFVTHGCAKVWGVIEGDDSISSSLNISATTGVTAGKVDLSITHSFSDSNWAGVCGPQGSQQVTSTLSDPTPNSMRINNRKTELLVAARSRLIVQGDLA